MANPESFYRGEPSVYPDPRYQTSNIAYWCYRTFLDYHKCVNLLGKSDKRCPHFKFTYTAICPNEWVARWNQQMKDGTFPGDIPTKDSSSDTC